MVHHGTSEVSLQVAGDSPCIGKAAEVMICYRTLTVIPCWTDVGAKARLVTVDFSDHIDNGVTRPDAKRSARVATLQPNENANK